MVRDICEFRNGAGGGCWTEFAVSDGTAGADCDCVVSVPGVYRGEGEEWRRKDGVERVRGARQPQIQDQKDRAVERAFSFTGEGIPGGATRGGGEGGRSDREHRGGWRGQPICD